MSKPTIRIHDMATGEVIDRVMTDAEYTKWQTQQVEAEAAAEVAAEQASAKQDVLDRLGITADEARMLLS